MTRLPVDLPVPAPARRAWLEARSLAVLARAGMIGVEAPWTVVAALRTVRDLGAFGGAVRIALLRHGDVPIVADERGELSLGELDARIDRLAHALRARGLGEGSTIGILCRNHRQPLIAAFAGSRIGATVVWLNTAFSAPQAAEVAGREGVELLVHDRELGDVAAGVDPSHGRVACAVDDPDADELDALIATGTAGGGAPPSRPGRIVLLTSGTTGTPKGAPRPDPRGFTIPGALLDRLPMRAKEATVVGPPLYHGTGLALALLSIGLGSKVVLRRQFDAARLLDDLERHRATTAVLVPVMLQRLLALGDDALRDRDLAALRVVFCAGSKLPTAVAERAMDALGDVVYDLYGSTEVAVATLATPADLRAAPTTVGRPALGARVEVLGDDDEPVPTGRTGRVFVGTTSPFEGYTGGGGKAIVRGLLDTGDVGHFDAQGRLFIDGRSDDMIVSGGENVFPGEVEEVLVAHPDVAEATVVGVEDEEFGQRLRAYVVLTAGASATDDELRAHVRDRLARFKVPRDVVLLDELPRNPTGKVLKRELR
ncbi:AMP-binding protein [Conexibacter sp. SYSU D00693]|uniref:AMP-binding protein n=1 Tax=Conexibacter sp. SYSU D00693 TaxID=2812560 RepID=UPI001F11D420|nr:AMP-binding protein [Conexibacter sp. SYSU D00693]